MSKPMQGVVAGVLFGVLTVLSMIPLEFPDKTAAMAGAFVDRFAIGVVIGCVTLAWPGWLVGAVFGLLLSLPPGLITKGFVPIVLVGVVGGTIIGAVIHRARKK